MGKQCHVQVTWLVWSQERKIESISNTYVQSWNPTGVYLILLKTQWRFSGTGDCIHHLISERQTSWLLLSNVVFYILLTSTFIFFKKWTHHSCSDPILIHSLFLLRKKCFQRSSWYITAGHRWAVGIYFSRYVTSNCQRQSSLCCTYGILKIEGNIANVTFRLHHPIWCHSVI